MEDIVVDDGKSDRRRMFVRRGGAKRRQPNGQSCHGHSGSGGNHRSGLWFDRMSLQEHVQSIEREAARQGADMAAVEEE